MTYTCYSRKLAKSLTRQGRNQHHSNILLWCKEETIFRNHHSVKSRQDLQPNIQRAEPAWLDAFLLTSILP